MRSRIHLKKIGLVAGLVITVLVVCFFRYKALLLEFVCHEPLRSQLPLAPILAEEKPFVSLLPRWTEAALKQQGLPSPIRRIALMSFDDDEEAEIVNESLVVMDKVILIPFGINSIIHKQKYTV